MRTRQISLPLTGEDDDSTGAFFRRYANSPKAAILVTACVMAVSTPSWANGGLASDAESVEAAVATATAALERQGFEISAIMNHAAAAESVGLSLRPTQVIFARPPRFIERALLKRGDKLGLDLPLKILVFEDEMGGIQVNTNSAGYLFDRHQMRTVDPLLWWLQGTATKFSEPEDGIITVTSTAGFEATVDNLRTAITSNPNLRLPLEINFSEDRPRRFGVRWWSRPKKGPMLLVFGNPNVGTPLMQAGQQIGLDLPQKFLVVDRGRGLTMIAYNDPFFVAKRHGIEGQDDRLVAMAAALARLADAGAGR